MAATMMLDMLRMLVPLMSLRAKLIGAFFSVHCVPVITLFATATAEAVEAAEDRRRRQQKEEAQLDDATMGLFKPPTDEGCIHVDC